MHKQSQWQFISRGLVILFIMAGITAASAFPPAPPNDPRYAPAACPSPGCLGPTGQWNLLSYWPNLLADPGHASGISADLAWDITTGRADVVVVVLDTGVNYDHEDLRNKIWLNCGELPAPQGAGGNTTPGSSPGCREPGLEYDHNGDGELSIRDYVDDPRITNIGPIGLSRADLRVFEDGIDDDGNGFIDDISGWDARDSDGDEFRTNGNGHGTGRNGFIAAETNNVTGIAGICPNCRLANVRVDGSFVHRTEGAAIGAIWAADHGHEVINMALGATSASSMARSAFDYYNRKNGLALNASANEFSFHHNFQSVFDDVMTIGAVAPDNTVATTTYLRKANFSNYGAHLDVVAPTDALTTSGGTGYGNSSGTSSAVPHAAGVAALVFSRARALIDQNQLNTTGLALKDISAQEVRQIINGTADDIVQADDPAAIAHFPLSTGWDRWTGYGRINARRAVDKVAAGTMPPEADINSPDWYRKVGRTTTVVPVEFYANARWATGFDWVLEVGVGVEPVVFTLIASGTSEAADPALSSASGVSNLSANWNTAGLPERFYTLRLRVIDNLGNRGEDRMGLWVQRADPHDQPGFPLTVAGVNANHPTSLESTGSSLVDLNGDNKLEILMSSGDGQIHAIQHDGTPLPGWPVRTDDVAGLPLASSDAFDGDPSNGEVVVSGASVVGGVSVADIDGDTVQEVCAGAYNGKLYCWDASGTLEPGFPVETDKGITRDQYTGANKPNFQGDAILAPPALEDLDGDGTLEIIVGAFDQKMYIWNHDGTRFAPWPKVIGSVNIANPAPIISNPVVADIDADDKMEIVFGTNETVGQNGLLYAYQFDGTPEPGWPVEVGPSPSPSAVPIVADGVGGSPVAADIDGDGTLEIAIGVFGGPPQIFNHDGSLFQIMNSLVGKAGPGRDLEEETPEGGFGSEPAVNYVALGALADVENDGKIDYINGTLGAGVLPVALGGGTLTDFDFYASVWSATTGQHKPMFPRVLEDWQFFSGAAVADIDGGADGVAEVIVASGGYFVHAFNGVTGLEPAGWPKNVGHWVVASPMVGDIDNDGTLEVVVSTRLGDVHVWRMPGDACQDSLGRPAVQWRRALHDEWSTGVLGRDTLRPAAITGLSLIGNTTLNFAGVGDDGHCGSAEYYEVRSVPGLVANPDWSAGADVALRPPGATHSVAVGSLTPPFTLMVRAFDEVGNGSAMASVQSLASSPVTAVLTVAALASTSVGALAESQLQFAATLHDGSNNPIAGRPLRFSAGGKPQCRAITNSTGKASCSASVAGTLNTVVGLSYVANFDGDKDYLPAEKGGAVVRAKVP